MTEISTDNVVSTYRRYAPLYDFLFGAVLSPGRKKMATAVHAMDPRTILEVGVGTGLALRHYPKTSCISGIDLSSEMLAKAKMQAERLSEHSITLLEMNAESLQFEDDTFDCITVPYVLSVTPNPDRLVSELRRVCKQGGHIVIVNHFTGSRFWWLLERMVSSVADRIGFRSDFDYERHILSHSWTVQRSVPVNLFGLSRMVVIRND